MRIECALKKHYPVPPQKHLSDAWSPEDGCKVVYRSEAAQTTHYLCTEHITCSDRKRAIMLENKENKSKQT